MRDLAAMELPVVSAQWITGIRTPLDQRMVEVGKALARVVARFAIREISVVIDHAIEHGIAWSLSSAGEVARRKAET